MLRHAHFYMKGGKEPFAAVAKQQTGRTFIQARIRDFSATLSAAVNPLYRFPTASPIFVILVGFSKAFM